MAFVVFDDSWDVAGVVGFLLAVIVIIELQEAHFFGLISLQDGLEFHAGAFVTGISLLFEAGDEALLLLHVLPRQVAVRPRGRGRGVESTIIKFLINFCKYSLYLT